MVVPFSVRVDLQQCTMPVYLCSTEMEMMENGTLLSTKSYCMYVATAMYVQHLWG